MVDMFLILEGLKGEVVRPPHVGATEILSWSWGLQSSERYDREDPQTTAFVANVQDLSLTKYSNSMTTALVEACEKARLFPKAELYIHQPKRSEFLIRITLTDVRIASMSMGGSGGEERLTENLTLTFAGHRYEFGSFAPGKGAKVPADRKIKARRSVR